MGNAHKTVVIISEDTNQRRDGTNNDLRESGHKRVKLIQMT
jgi:hypothetical protein